MKLTKLQRHTAYIIMLEALQRCTYGIGKGICAISYEIFDIYPNVDKSCCWNKGNDVLFEDTYSELIKYASKFGGNLDAGFWFDRTEIGDAKRIKLLKHCIKETYEP